MQRPDPASLFDSCLFAVDLQRHDGYIVQPDGIGARRCSIQSEDVYCSGGPVGAMSAGPFHMLGAHRRRGPIWSIWSRERLVREGTLVERRALCMQRCRVRHGDRLRLASVRGASFAARDAGRRPRRACRAGGRRAQPSFPAEPGSGLPPITGQALFTRLSSRLGHSCQGPGRRRLRPNDACRAAYITRLSGRACATSPIRRADLMKHTGDLAVISLRARAELLWCDGPPAALDSTPPWPRAMCIDWLAPRRPYATHATNARVRGWCVVILCSGSEPESARVVHLDGRVGRAAAKHETQVREPWSLA